MSFILFASQLQKAQKESAAWQLLRSNNVHFVLAFINDVFKDNQEIDYEQAKFMLGNFMEQARQGLGWDTDKNAGSYLNEWTKAGWLRETDNKLIMTDASTTALRFADQLLSPRIATTSASHLDLVANYMRNVALALSDDKNKHLESHRREMEFHKEKINEIQSDNWVPISKEIKIEQIKELYHQVQQLFFDFRSYDEDFRSHRAEIHKMLIESDKSKGAVIGLVLQMIGKLEKTDAGLTFDNFYKLLSDYNRKIELKEHIKFIVSGSLARETLNKEQLVLLSNFVDYLNLEAKPIFKLRKKIFEDTNSFIENDEVLESRAIDKQIKQFEKQMLRLKENEINIKKKDLSTDLLLDSCLIEIQSPMQLKLKEDDGSIETEDNIEIAVAKPVQQNMEMLNRKKRIDIKNLARKVRQALINNGPMTVKDISQIMPITEGPQGLLAYLRIATLVGVEIDDNKKEVVLFKNPSGSNLQGNIPVLLFDENMFTEDSINNLSF